VRLLRLLGQAQRDPDAVEDGEAVVLKVFLHIIWRLSNLIKEKSSYFF
jgi:hypothetical protein